jgi:hypothetical protein
MIEHQRGGRAAQVMKTLKRQAIPGDDRDSV